MKYVKEIYQMKAEQQIERLLDEAVEELLSEELSLLERTTGRSSNQYNFDNNSTKWSETLIGKLFKKLTNIVTLNGLLTRKFKNVVGVKSNLLKRLANKLEEKIDRLPAEYLDRTVEVDLATRKLAYYDEMKKFFNDMSASTSVANAKTATANLASALPQLLVDLDISKSEAFSFDSEVKEKIKATKTLSAKLDKLDGDRQYDFSKYAAALGDKNEIVAKSTELAAKMHADIKQASKQKKVSNFIGDEDSPKTGKISGATKSMYDIVAIINKASDLYTEEYVGEDDRTVSKRDDRLFTVWEEKVMEILSTKADILPEPLKRYISASLQKDFKKYNVSSGDYSKNILDELNNIEATLVKAKEKEKKIEMQPDAVSGDKSTAMSIGYRKMDKGIRVQELQYKNSIIILKFAKGTMKEGNKVADLTKHVLVLTPLDMTRPNAFTCALTPSDDMYDNMRLTSGVTFNSTNMNMDSIGMVVDSYTLKMNFMIRSFYYAVVSERMFGPGSRFEAVCYKSDTNVDIKPNLDKPFATVEGVIEEVYGTFGTDGKIAYLDPSEVKKVFSTTHANFKALTQHYKVSKNL